ncbi:hypothetical protein CUMW_123080 [Citrus unshiu]|uniref:Uncharacterized protein n=1 Tax=Citrus unshiu TaxID=55188 RepID=A0A2H5PC75_CITUN|nr:hypothetical protein CUMW_123080 [Citrus unshiu]
MTSVRVPIMFCGELIEQNDHYRFNGTEARGIMVPRSITYAQLIEKVSRVICIDISEFDIEIKFKLKTFDPMPLVPIMNDDDVDYFLEETISGAELKIPLCITYQRKQILVTPITHVDPNFGPDSCLEEHVEPYVEGECLSLNNFVVEDQSIFEFVLETQPNDRRYYTEASQFSYCDFSIEVLPNFKILKSCCKMEDETLKESGGITATGLHRSAVDLLVLLRFG